MTTPSRNALNQGYIGELEVGDTLTLHPSPETRTIVVRLLAKSGRRARVRVQSHSTVEVSTEAGKKLARAG